MASYSFLDVLGAIAGPGGNFPLGAGAAAADEGITIENDEDVNTKVVGADGTVMHSLHADQSGTVTVRLLKTSPVNALLANMYQVQTSSSALHGANTVTVNNRATGDNITCELVAFKKAPNIVYAKDGGINEWIFSAGRITRILGIGQPAI